MKDRSRPYPLSTEQAFIEIMKSEAGRQVAFHCYYEWDVLSACRRFEAGEEWRAARAYLDAAALPGREALDLGAGNGIASYALAETGFNVTAVEPDPSDLVGHGALRRMQAATGLPIRLASAYGERLPFADRAFSVVYVRQVLHHAHDLPRMLSETARVLKPGGVFLAVREHVVDGPQSREAFLQAHAVHKYTGQEGAFRLDEYLGAIRASGLGLMTVLGPWDSVINHYPCSNAELQAELRARARRLGRLGAGLAGAPGIVRLYRQLKTAKDRSPGRMYTFVARA